METMTVALVFAAAFLAFLVSSVAGGGAGLVLVPLLRLLVPIQSIPGALSIGTAVSSASRIRAFRRRIRWDVVRRFVPTALPAAGLGAWLLTLFETAYVEFALGCFLLLNIPALFRRATPPPTGDPAATMRRLPLLGAAAGLLSGFTGAVGVVFNGQYLRLGLGKEEIVATRATNEVSLHVLKVALYGSFGLLPRAALLAGILVAAAALLSSLCAPRVVAMLDERAFRRIGLLAMVASGVALFSLSGRQIMEVHEAWVSHVAPDDERELQLYWGGTRRLAIEREDDGRVVAERMIPYSSLPAPVKERLRGSGIAGSVVLVEAVHGADSPYYEIYHRASGRPGKVELAADGRILERSD